MSATTKTLTNGVSSAITDWENPQLQVNFVYGSINKNTRINIKCSLDGVNYADVASINPGTNYTWIYKINGTINGVSYKVEILNAEVINDTIYYQNE